MHHAHSSSLGEDAELLTSASAGIIQVPANSQKCDVPVPDVGLSGLPFLFQDLPTAWAVIDSAAISGSGIGQTVKWLLTFHAVAIVVFLLVSYAPALTIY